jgi:hypothetical protein
MVTLIATVIVSVTKIEGISTSGVKPANNPPILANAVTNAIFIILFKLYIYLFKYCNIVSGIKLGNFSRIYVRFD